MWMKIFILVTVLHAAGVVMPHMLNILSLRISACASRKSQLRGSCIRCPWWHCDGSGQAGKDRVWDKVGIIGLGLLGQLTVQILKAAGCHVFASDISERKCELALQSGAEAVALIGKDDPLAISKEFSHGEGLDAVIIFASTESNEPLVQAADMCRERGRIIAGGLVGLNIPRDVFYKKELDFAVSRAWGPGMYGPDYEERNIKYPLPYVRWTAKRNMEEFLRMLSLGTVKTTHLTTHKFPFDKALEAYEMMLKGKQPVIGVILEYPEREFNVSREAIKIETKAQRSKVTGKLGIGLIGAGLFARGTLLPALKKNSDIELIGVASSRGLSAKAVADSEKFRYAASDYQEILKDETINMVFILTRHNSHARFICEALRAGKAVYVEKPLGNDYIAEEDIPLVYCLSRIHHTTYRHPGNNLLVEMHWGFGVPYFFKLDSEEIWNGGVTSESGKAGLSPEMIMIMLLIHHHSHSFRELKILVDILWGLHKYDNEIDWYEFAKRLRKIGLLKSTQIILNQIQSLWKETAEEMKSVQILKQEIALMGYKARFSPFLFPDGFK